MKPAVLMLGWEFPPLINGGLGVACKGLGDALSQYLNVTMMIPQAALELVNMPDTGVELIGAEPPMAPLPTSLPQSEPSLHYAGVEKHLHHMEVAQIVADLRIYRPAADILVAAPLSRSTKSRQEKTINRLQQALPRESLYGQGLLGEVIEFSKQSTRVAAAKQFDIIHAHDWMTFWAGLEIQAKSGKPLVLHIHSLEYDRAGSDRFRNDVFSLEKFALEQADLVMPVSHYTARILETIYGIPAEKIFPVHNGGEAVTPYRKARPFPEKLVSFAGRITRQKGPARFLDMALQVLSQVDNVRFVMAGKGDMLSDMIEAVAMLGIGDRFHFTGFLNGDKLQDLYAMSDVFVLPSVSEPFGLAALEAAGMGTPCVVTDQSGVREILPSAPAVDSEDPAAMAAAVLEILQDADRAAALATQCQAEAAAATWDKAAFQVMRGYEMLG